MPAIPIYFDKDTYKRLTEEKERSPLIKTLLHRHWRKQKDNELAKNLVEGLSKENADQSPYGNGWRDALTELIKRLP